MAGAEVVGAPGCQSRPLGDGAPARPHGHWWPTGRAAVSPQLACRYVPAQTAADVGGDWFDVIPLSAGRCALTVGDVTGHDLHAAALMGQLRTATRAFATLDLPPAETLSRLDRLTADITDEETSATCIYAVHDGGRLGAPVRDRPDPRLLPGPPIRPTPFGLS